MINTDRFRGKKVLVAGLARSGVASANLLYGLGAKVSVTDNQDTAQIRANAEELKSKDILVELGRHTIDFVKPNDILVLSPGVPKDSPVVAWAEELKIPIIGEIELAWQLCPAKVIAITGTNGKTTVTTLTGKILEKAGLGVYVCGNIGTPFTSEVSKIKESDYACLEISSFQLERITTFKPKVSVILNLSRNHLDRYKDMESYLADKKRIFMNQDSGDSLVLNYDDPVIRDLAKETKAKVVYFQKEHGLNANQSACLAVSSVLGIERAIALEVFKEFKGVEHRMEEVAEINNIRFINDSKSTTTEATVWALNNLDNPIVLIAGGREKGNDYSAVLGLARKKVKAAVLIGEAKDKIKKAFGESLALDEAGSLDEAVRLAYSKASPGDYVLFSPMCKSFDMFLNYEDRGRKFKESVFNIAKKN